MAQVNAGRVRFVSRGEYNNSTQYYLFDLVDYNGSSYFAKANTTGNVPTNTTYWQLVAEKGNTGGDGPVGPTGNGIASIAKTSSAGLIDTYTITYTNGTTTTFEITNGQDGEVTQEYVDEHDDELRTLFNVLPKVSGSGESVTLNGTGDTMLYKMDLKGNTSQEVVQGEVGLEVNDTSIYVDDVNEDKENYIALNGNTSQETTTGKNLTNLRNVNTTTAGTTVKSNEDGSIKVTGTATGTYGNVTTYNANNLTGSFKAKIGNTSSLNGENTIKPYIWLRSSGTTVATLNNNNGYNGYTTSTIDSIVIGIENLTSGTTYNETLYVELENTSTVPTSYEPYTNGASPNPDYPQEVEVVTGLNEVEVCGKNVFNIAKLENASWNYPNSNTRVTMFLDKVAQGIKMSVTNRDTTNYRFSVGFTKLGYASRDNIMVNESGWQTTSTYTITASGEGYPFLQISRIDNGNISASEVEGKFQYEYGDTATTYEAYQGASYPVNLGSIELCKIGAYQDRIYKSNIDNNWYVHKEIGKVVLDGTNNVFDSKSGQLGNCYVFNTSNFIVGPELDVVPSFLSNKFIPKSWNERNDYLDSAIMFLYRTTSTLNFRFGTSSSLTTLELANAWLVNNNVTFYGILSTPTETQITDTTLISQLNALYNATIYSTTHINTETSNLLPYIDLKYNVVTPAPSPDRASEVEVVKGNNVIKVQSKNLFDIPLENGSSNGVTWTVNENGSITLNGTSTNHININSSSLNIPVTEGETYTISATNILAGNIGFKELNGADIWVLSKYSLTKTKIITSDMQTTNVKFSIYIPPSNTFNNVTITFQLEKGNQATTYVPYQSQSYNITLGNLEFCKIGDYQDYIYYDKSADKWYKYGAIGKVVFDGTEYWEGGSSATVSTNYTYVYTQAIDNLAKTGVYTCFNNKLDTLNGPMLADTSVSTDTLSCGSSGYNRVRIMILTSRLSSANVNGFKNWLSNNNVTLYYILTTPTTTEITNSTLIAQLNELKKAMSYYDKTLITQTNAKKPFILDVVGIRDLQDIFELISGE